MNARVLCLLALAGAASCAPDRSSISLEAVCFPSEDCTFTETCDKQYIGPYVMAGVGYFWAPIQVANRTPNNENIVVGRTNSNDAHVTGVDVEAPDGSVTSVAFMPNQWVPAESTAVVGVYVPVSTSGTHNIRLTGYFDNGNDFKTGDFPLNIAIGGTGYCDTGQVQSCPAGSGTDAVEKDQLPAACKAP